MTLIDTSAWVDFFRGDRVARRRVDPLLESGQAATCGAIYAEVLSGAKDRVIYDRLAVLFGSLVWLTFVEDAWTRVAELRFLLARQCVQAHLMDLLIAHTAVDQQATLLTRDRDFERIAFVLPVELAIF